MQISDPIGRMVQYGYDLNGDLGVVTDTRGLAWTMTYTSTPLSAGTGHLLYEITDPEGHTVERQDYDGQGRAVRQWDGLGNELVLTYNADGTVTVTDARGNVITDTYDARNTLTAQENPLGDSPSYTYDDDFNRTSATDENGHTTYYEWEACCGLLSVITDTLGHATRMTYDQRHNLTSRTDALGRTTSYQYDADNNLIRTTDPLSGTVVYTYTARGQVLSTTDENGHTTTYGYDAFGQRVAITDALGTVTRFGYDGVGRLVTTTVEIGDQGSEIRVTVNEYDGGDNLVRVTENYLPGQPPNYLNEYNLITEYAYDGAGNRTQITNPQSQITKYEYDAANRLIRTTENHDPARTQNEDDVYNIVTEYGYDEIGNQVAVTDTLGRVTRTEYDVLNRPITVTVNYVEGGPVDEETNLTTLYAYDAVGNRTTVTDALGRVTKTDYDVLNRPITVTVNYVEGGPVDEETNVTTLYAYDEVGNREQITDPESRITKYEYDELNRTERVIANYVDGVYDPAHPDEDVATEYAYDPAGNRIQITNPQSQITQYDYDALNRPVTVTLNYVQGGPLDSETNVTTLYSYDELGNRVQVTDPKSQITQYEYDSLGRLITVTNALSGTTRYEYDALGNRTRVVDANGHETVYGYDDLNRLEWVSDALTGTVHYAYDPLGNRISVTDQNNHVTTYGYDDLNRLEQVTDAEGHTTTYGYDRVGNRVQITNPQSQITTYEYDDLNRLEAVVDPENNRTEYGYDAVGNRVSLTDAEGVVTRYEYDGLNRLTGVVENYVDGGPVDQETNVHTTYGYDAAGNRTSVTDGNDHATTYEYDDLNRLEATLDPLTHRTEYGYDRVGNRTVMTDANGFTTFYSYDALNRLVLVDYPAPDPDVTFGYDPVGNREAMTDTTGTTHYEYDPAYRLTEVTDGAGQTVGYGYDAVGNRTGLVYPDSKTVSYSYDDANRLETVTDWDSQVVTYTYDGANRLTGVDLPNGIDTAYGYDDAGRLLTVTHDTLTGTLLAFTYTLDGVGNRVQAVEGAPPPWWDVYLPIILKNASGGSTMALTGGEPAVLPGLFTSPLPDPFHSPLPTPTPTPPATIEGLMAALDAAYQQGQIDKQGIYNSLRKKLTKAQEYIGQGQADKAVQELENFIKQVEKQRGKHVREEAADQLMALAQQLVAKLQQGEEPGRRGAGPGESLTIPWRTITYTYDSLYRLTDADYSTGELYQYAYDAVGNRLSYNGPDGSKTYAYDAANRLTSVNGVVYTWDDNGNLLSDGVRSYTYDHANRLTQVVSGTLTTEFVYNGAGDRVAKTMDGVETRYTLDPAAGLTQILQETTGGQTTSYLYGHDLLAQYDSGTWAYHVNDGLGSVRGLADPAGQVVQGYSFSPFGVPLGESGGEPYGFTGEQWDASAGLVFLRARYYQPGVGRFINKDPWPGMAQKPGTRNGYTYVLNNAPNGTDPSGMWCLFGIGNCDEEPDLAIVAYYILVQTDFCLPGDLGCWGGEPQGIGWEDIKELQDSGEFYADMYWTYYHWAEAWGLSPDSIKTLMYQTWFFELGREDELYFDENHPATQILMHHKGVSDFREEFYQSGCQNIEDKWCTPAEGDLERALAEVRSHGQVGYETLVGIEDSERTINGTLGSYRVTITNNGDGTASFEVYNPTSWESFLRLPFAVEAEDVDSLGKAVLFVIYRSWKALMPEAKERTETDPNLLCDEGCGGNLDQYFSWTEDIPLGVCCGSP